MTTTATYATGKRKDAVARVWIKPGSGRFTINERTAEVYFARPVLESSSPALVEFSLAARRLEQRFARPPKTLWVNGFSLV